MLYKTEHVNFLGKFMENPELRPEQLIQYLFLRPNLKTIKINLWIKVETGFFGVFAKVPVTRNEGSEEFGMFRLRHGLWLEINTRNGDVVFTQACLDAMRLSPSESYGF